MATSSLLRRLAAVVVVDVVGYSAMMAADEEGTLAALKAHRNETDPIVLNHGGRIVKGTGDGILVEFPSAVEAVRAAVETQRLMAERNAAAPDDRRMHYRIGINLGDVMVDEDGDIYGDGVNIAARLEAAADPGGICVSGAIHGQVHDTVDVSFEALGQLAVKNLPRPIEAWRVVTGDLPTPAPPTAPSSYSLPSVAVLPFDNLSGDADQEYFVDGLVEDLITSLSQHRDLRIVSRNSTFAYRGRVGDIRDTARELDATYVVEGSARRAGNRVRITAQLIEAETGHHVWADRFDRELDDIFAVQDEVVSEIAGHIHPSVERAQGEKLGRSRPESLDTWDLVQRAKWHIHGHTQAGTEEAVRVLSLALERDPGLVVGHQWLAYAWIQAAFNSWRILDRNPWTEGRTSAGEAYRLAPADPISVVAWGFAQEYAGNLDDALDLARRALHMAPRDPLALHLFGQVMFFRGEFGTAIEQLSNAWRRARHEPWRFHISNSLAFSHYLARRYEAAEAWAERTLQITDYLQTRAIYAATLAQLGRSQDASYQVGALTSARPDLRASENFRELQGTLADLEDHIQKSRRYYNAVVRDYNTKIGQVPSNVIARSFGFKQRDFFEMAEAERALPQVRFGDDA